MGESSIPATLGEAIATEPSWLQLWVLVVMVIFSIAGRQSIMRLSESWKYWSN
jgi:hypothetical protein